MTAGKKLEAASRFELEMEVLQTSALPLGYAANLVERETGFEPATSTLARLHSTTELLPREGRKPTLSPQHCQAPGGTSRRAGGRIRRGKRTPGLARPHAPLNTVNGFTPRKAARPQNAPCRKSWNIRV